MLDYLFSWIIARGALLLDLLLNNFASFLSFDMQQFVEFFPAAYGMYTIIRGVAIGLCVTIAMLQLVKYFLSPIAQVKESPALIVFRLVMAICFIYLGQYVLDLIIEFFKGPYSKIINYRLKPFAFNIQDALNSVGTEVSGLVVDAAVTGGVLRSALTFAKFVLFVSLALNIIKFIVEICERWIMLGVLVYTAPLGWCTLTSESTMGIFKKWITMFFSQCLILFVSAWSLKMTLSIIIESSETAIGGFTMIMKLLLAIAFARLAQRFDSYINQLGLNAAVTSGNLLDEIVGVGAAMNSNVKSLFLGGNSSGGRNAGSSSNNAPLGAAALGAMGAGGIVKSSIFSRGALGTAVSSMRQGFKEGTKAAMENGKSLFGEKTGQKNRFGFNKRSNSAVEEGWEQAKHTFLNNYSRNKANNIERNVKQALDEKMHGNSERFDRLTAAEKKLAQQYQEEMASNKAKASKISKGLGGAAVVSPNSSGMLVPNQEDNNGEDVYKPNIGFDGAAASAGAFLGEDGAGNTVVRSEEGEDNTSDIINNSIENADSLLTGATENADTDFWDTINNTVADYSDSGHAIDTSLPSDWDSDSDSESVSNQERLFFSSLVGTGMRGDDYGLESEKTSFWSDEEDTENESGSSSGTKADNIVSHEPWGLSSTIEQMSKGNRSEKIRFDTSEHEAPKWDTDVASGGHKTSFNYSPTGEFGADTYKVTYMDQKYYDKAKRENKNDPIINNARAYRDKNGNVMYVSRYNIEAQRAEDQARAERRRDQARAGRQKDQTRTGRQKDQTRTERRNKR